MIKKFIRLIFLFFLFTLPALSEVIEKIEISGNNRISENTIINFSQVQIGKNYSDDDFNKFLKNLYNTSFFEKVSFKITNKTLLITVTEFPIIRRILLNGIKSETLRKQILDQLDFKEKGPFNKSLLNDNVNLITNSFKLSGYYFANIEPSFLKINDSTIDLILQIDRGEKASIKNIEFIGDKKFKKRKLLSIITSENDKFWKFLSKKKYLDTQRIDLDKRLLKNFYLENGYYQVNIIDAYSKITGKNNFQLIFNIDAGDKFYFNDLKLNLPDDLDITKFSKLDSYFKEVKGETYNLKIIEKILNEIEQISLLENYEFINANIDEKIINEDKLDLTFSIVETEKVYVDRINIFGNSVTSEQFIRDNFLVDEGDPLNKILYNKSINKLKSTRLFKSVNDEVIIPNDGGLATIDITIEEKPTGEISAAAGYGSDGSSISFGVKENNFKGLGVKLETNLAITEDSIKGLLSYTDPNFLYSDKSLTTSIESTTTDKLTDYGYKSSLNAISLGTSYEYYKDFFFSPQMSISNEKLDTTSTASVAYKKQEGSYFDLNLGYGLNYDKRNRYFQPSDGFMSKWYQKLPLLSDDGALFNSYEISFYREPRDNMIISTNLYAGAVNSLTNDDVRVSKRIYAPSYRLRGFEVGKVGPKDGNDFIGGNYIATFNSSTTLPYLLETLENIDLKLFLDMGNVWGVDYDSSIDDSNKLRSSTGLALEILTPVGPLTFSYAEAITKASTDVTETFKFQLGTTF